MNDQIKAVVIQSLKELEQYIKSKDKTETVKIGIHEFEFNKKYRLYYDSDSLASKIEYFRNLGLNKTDFSDDGIKALINAFSSVYGVIYLNSGLDRLFNNIYSSKGVLFDFTNCCHEVTLTKIKDKK